MTRRVVGYTYYSLLFIILVNKVRKVSFLCGSTIAQDTSLFLSDTVMHTERNMKDNASLTLATGLIDSCLFVSHMKPFNVIHFDNNTGTVIRNYMWAGTGNDFITSHGFNEKKIQI